jgi:hypothetical protein
VEEVRASVRARAAQHAASTQHAPNYAPHKTPRCLKRTAAEAFAGDKEEGRAGEGDSGTGEWSVRDGTNVNNESSDTFEGSMNGDAETSAERSSSFMQWATEVEASMDHSALLLNQLLAAGVGDKH